MKDGSKEYSTLHRGYELVKDEIVNIEKRKERDLDEARAHKRKKQEWEEQCELAKVDWYERQTEKKIKEEMKTGTHNPAPNADMKAMFEERKRRMQALEPNMRVESEEESDEEYSD